MIVPSPHVPAQNKVNFEYVRLAHARDYKDSFKMLKDYPKSYKLHIARALELGFIVNISTNQP